MMRASWKKNLSMLLAMAIVWASFSCVGLNPAGPPAPLAELPSSLSFPDSIAIDVSETNIAGGSSASIFFKAIEYAKAQVLPIGGEFFDAIIFGFTINQLIDAAVGVTLLDLSQLDIPLNPVTRTFQVDTPGAVIIGASIKIDFADYDFDGTGTTKGCTGCTCPTGCDAPCPTEAAFEDLKPVCYRIWSDLFGTGSYTRLMAGFFEQIPIEDDPTTTDVDEENPGVGSYRVSLDQGSPNGGPLHFFNNLGANYIHRVPGRPFDKSTEYFISIITPIILPVSATNSSVKVQQVALEGAVSEDQVMKTIQESVNQEKFDDPTFTSTSLYTARYRTDEDLWSGSFDNALLFPDTSFAPPPDIANFTAACAQLSTAIGVDQGACIDAGIDVTNVPFLDLITSDDPRVNLPADFPAFPTF